MNATIIRYLRERRLAQSHAGQVPPLERTSSRVGSIHESLYLNRTSFLRRTMRKVAFRGKVAVKPEELKRISTIQAHDIGQTLARHPSRTVMAAHSVAGPSKLE